MLRDVKPHPAEPEGQAHYAGPDRRHDPCPPECEPVVLTKKLADVLDGIEVGDRGVGDRLCLEQEEAALLVAEGWAAPVAPHERRRAS